MKSVMDHEFSRIPQAEIQRSVFNRSHGYKTTFNEGYLVPFYVDEVLPGDTVDLKTNLFARLATPIVPFMDNVFLETFFFYVPNRLVWENWERMNGAQDNPGDSTDFLVPQLSSGTSGFAVQSLADYFGLPTGVANIKVSALPFRAYNLIYNEWFRDENLQDSVEVLRGDSDDLANYTLLKRGKRHDYFTSCLPWPQKGDAVQLPVSATVKYTGEQNSYPANLSGAFTASSNFSAGGLLGFSVNRTSVNTGSFGSSGYNYFDNGTNTLHPGSGSLNQVFSKQFYTDLASNLAVDNASGSSITINELRQAFQIQKLLERDARGGTRYTEILRSHFGVISPDARLQRPEYLGGSSTRININPVAQTGSTDSVTPQGNLAAFGTAGDSFQGFTKSFVEHGFIIGLVNVRADLTYQQGLSRMWSRKSRFDFYYPVLAHLGEQAVLNKEIYCDGSADDEKVFGYQERYAEYRYFPSLITGKFRSSDSQSLDYWHLSQHFQNRPVLNAEFIQDNPPISRVVAVPSEPHFLLDCYFDVKEARPMPVYGVPGLVDHF